MQTPAKTPAQTSETAVTSPATAKAKAALAALDDALAYYAPEPLPASEAPAYTAPLAA